MFRCAGGGREDFSYDLHLPYGRKERLFVDQEADVAGLKSRFITITFPELTEDGDEILYVTVRNPKLVPIEWLRSRVATNPDGTPVNDDAATQESYERVAKLITDIRMYDAEDPNIDQALLTMPMTAEKVAKLPIIVNNRIAEELTRVNENPTTTPDSPTS